MKISLIISRIIAGLIFIFSGTVKAIDPMGSAYKFQDYFTAFNLDFLYPLSLPFAILLCSAEFFAGFSVLFNIRQKSGIWILMLMMMVFTPLTLVLAITNPVSDCGCFGDVIHLTNWQTFIKNTIILVPVIWLFINRNKVIPRHGMIREWIMVSAILILFASFSFYNLRYLPVIDFLPYKTGTYIPDKMVIPEGKPVDKYETTFIYEKDGVQKEFTLENYPSDDTTWKFVDQRSVLVSKGYVPPIHDFALTTLNNENITDHVLSSETYTFFMVCRKIENIDPEKCTTGIETGNRLAEEGAEFYILTASGTDEILKFGNTLPFCSVDEITLKTMIRSDPGYMLLRKGTIIAKWSWVNLPSAKELTSEYLNQ